MEHLNITFCTQQQRTAISQLIYLITKNQCHVEESRMTMLGTEFTGMMRVAGNWSAIAKVEAGIISLQNESDIKIQCKRGKSLKIEGNHLPYLAQVVALDTPEVVHEVSHFFAAQNILIVDLQTDPFKTNYSDTMMLTLSLRISIPATINIADLREHFMVLCDDLNIDGIIEPEKRG